MTSSKKPTIYWLHSHFLLATGGTRFIFEVIQELVKKYEVVVCVEKSNPEWLKKYRDLGVEVKSLSPLSSNSVWYWLGFPAFLVWDYWQLKKLIKPENVVITSMFPMNVLAASLTSKSIYYCFEPFAFFYDQDLIGSFSMGKQFLLRLLAFFLAPLDKWAVEQTQTLLAINPSVGEWIAKMYGRLPDQVTYLGVDTKVFKPKAVSKKKSNDHVTIFHSTDYSLLKGTNYLLQALTYLKSQSFIKVTISETFTDPVRKKEYQDIITSQGLENRVTFVGHVPYAKLAHSYQTSDIYCFVGNPDSTGATAASMSVLEAAATGLPVIRSIGNKDEVIDGKTGLVIDPRYPQVLAQAILALASDAKLRHKLGDAAYKHVHHRYTWPKVAQVISQSIESLL